MHILLMKQLLVTNYIQYLNFYAVKNYKKKILKGYACLIIIYNFSEIYFRRNEAKEGS